MNVTLNHDEMAAWSRFIHEICGVHLDESKGYLLQTRLAALLQESGTHTYAEFYYKAKADRSSGLRRKIIDAITTNETSFFRDASPFEMIQHKLLPELVDRRRKAGRVPVPIRVWSAACSTGQEIYSTAIAIKEVLGDLRGYDVRLMGTDISDRAVACASQAVFSRGDLDRGMPAEKLARYFAASGGNWRVRDEIRALATFKTMNLLEPFSFPAPFDIVLCRNVAIYFTEADKLRLYRGIRGAMAPDGALIIGATESLTGLCPELEPKRHLRGVFYQNKAAPNGNGTAIRR